MIHATRAAYQAGCRCLPCRAANARYTVQIRRHPSPLAPADLARAYLAALAARGLGVRQQAKLAGVSHTTVERVRSGHARLIHARILARLLAIRPVLAPGCHVPAAETLHCLWLLVEEGYTEQQIAQYVGRRDGQIPMPRGPLVTVRTAARIRAVTRALLGEEVENA